MSLLPIRNLRDIIIMGHFYIFNNGDNILILYIAAIYSIGFGIMVLIYKYKYIYIFFLFEEESGRTGRPSGMITTSVWWETGSVSTKRRVVNRQSRFRLLTSPSFYVRFPRTPWKHNIVYILSYTIEEKSSMRIIKNNIDPAGELWLFKGKRQKL